MKIDLKLNQFFFFKLSMLRAKSQQQKRKNGLSLQEFHSSVQH